LNNFIRRGLFVGRFQPLHLGHVEVIKRLLKEVDELIIVIGSSQKSHELSNPFTSGERIMMIRSALSDLKIEPSKDYLIPVPDAPTHSVWVSHLISCVPPFEIVYSNDALTRRLFKEANISVKNIPFIKRDLYSATEVRREILVDEDWQRLVPKRVSEIIIQCGGIERIKDLATSDSPIKRLTES
jgi:nicotinamide-nucleotide adenylyltransferase